MVVIRRELPRTSFVGQAVCLPHSSAEGPPFRVPFARRSLCSERKRSRIFPLKCTVDLRDSTMLLRAISLLVFDLYSDGPDESEQFTSDGRDYFLSELPLGHEAPVARAETVLCLPGDLLDLLTQFLLPLLEDGGHGRPILVCSGRLTDDAAEVGVSSLGDRSPADASSA